MIRTTAPLPRTKGGLKILGFCSRIPYNDRLKLVQHSTGRSRAEVEKTYNPDRYHICLVEYPNGTTGVQLVNKANIEVPQDWKQEPLYHDFNPDVAKTMASIRAQENESSAA